MLFKELKRVVEKYVVGDGVENVRKYMVVINWVLFDIVLDFEIEFVFGFLDYLMFGIFGFFFWKVLMESGLGELIIGGGIEDEFC